MSTLIGTDGMSMLNYRQRTNLFQGTREECEARLAYYQEHKELGYYDLKVL